MKKTSLFLSGIGATAFTVGGAGLDGPTQVGCIIVSLVGILIFLSGVILREMHKQDLEEQAKAKSEQEQRKDEFIKVWESCQM